MKRMNAILLASALLSSPSVADPLHDYVVGALTAEEQQTHVRTEFSVRRGGKFTEYLIERIQPDRMHLRLRAAGAEQEYFIVGPTMYVRSNGSWRGMPVPRRREAIPSLTPFIAQRLSRIREVTQDGRQSVERRFAIEDFDWTTGTSRNIGALEISVDAVRQLPSRMSFDGRCGDDPCRFDQTLTYDANLTIQPPVP